LRKHRHRRRRRARRRRQVNEVAFSVTGLGKFQGRLAVSASYATAPPPRDGSRVEIAFESAKLSPDALEALFRSNYDLLLSVFNPEGWLDVTYLDGELRVGRDDKGNVFVVERCVSAAAAAAAAT
jgi:hypothetical protein